MGRAALLHAGTRRRFSLIIPGAGCASLYQRHPLLLEKPETGGGQALQIHLRARLETGERLKVMSTEPNKVIYSMVGVSKFYDKKPVLKDIYLSYFYGAKIGVIGLNGSGKSSLLRILAGVDKDFNGETVISPGFTVGYLEQEPLLDDNRSVREVVEEAVQETVDLLKEFDDINNAFA